MTMDWSKIKLTQESLLNAMRLPEYQSTIATMSYRQLHTELIQLESLKTQVMKKQEADEANNRELHAALKKEGEELEDQNRKKRQFNRLKEILEAPTQHGIIATSPSLETIEALESSFPDLETLASLNKKSRLAVHVKILDEICTQWPKSTAVQRQLHHVPGLRRRLRSRKGSGSKSSNHESQLGVFMPIEKLLPFRMKNA